MLSDQLLRHRFFSQRCIHQRRQQTTVDQKMRLACIAQHMQTRVLRGHCNAGEIHMRGDVFLPHIHQRVGV